MKKLTILLVIICLGLSGFAQKKSGTIYYEHELIDKTKAMWSSLIHGDRETFESYFADSILFFSNGKPTKYPRKAMGNFVAYWSGFENLEITDDHKSNPDVLAYGDIMFVQDWLKFHGTHKRTGITSNVNMHNQYRFDIKGKIIVMYTYFDANFFDEVEDNSMTIENGIVYKNHPFIIKVRKLLNAYAAMDLEKWEKYFAPNATFSNSSMKPSEYMSLAERKEEMKDLFSTREKLTFTQVGYPDCIHYANGDGYMVFSWWTAKDVNKDGEVYEFKLFLTHNINDDGKVTREEAYFSYQAEE